MNLTFEQNRKYFEHRLGRSLPARDRVAVKCPLHDDHNPSATVFLDGNGGFHCNGCGAKGNIFQFEMRFSNCDLETAKRNIAEITGAQLDQSNSIGKHIASYYYRRADGTIAFRKDRYLQADGHKTFPQYRMAGDKWRPGLAEDTPRVLYNLPDLITANLVLLPEGEKDCDTLMQLSPWPDRPDLRIAATTNSEGAWQAHQAPKWLDSYSRQFAGKTVIVFEDNDQAGRARADYVCKSIHPYAESVRLVTFRDMPPKSDVTDWMERGHTVDDLRKLITSAPLWKPESDKETRSRSVLVDFEEFVTDDDEEIDWMVEGIIERDSNGFIAAPPKGAKSFTSADLVISLATGTPWLGFGIPRPVRVALVSREDNPKLTRWRLRSLTQGKGLNAIQLQMLKANLYLNSRKQTPTLTLDNEAEMNELISEFRSREIEFALLDVFNLLHTSDENDNTEMRKVLNHCRRIQDESGASIGILHHFSKDMSGSITQRLRGASAIAGFAEWMIGINMSDESAKIRRMEFELKAACPPEPIYFHIQAPEGQPGKITRVTCQPPATPESNRSAKGVN